MIRNSRLTLADDPQQPADAGRSPMPPFTRLVIPRAILDAVLTHARGEVPNECCGLLAGVIENGTGRVTARFALRNDRASPTEYAANPRDMLHALRAVAAAGTEVLAVYHSHPTSAPIPSRADLARNAWGESVVHLIIGLAGDQPDIRAWWLGATEYRPAIVELHPS